MSKKIFFSLAGIILLGNLITAAPVSKLTLAEKGQSSYQIILSDDASPSTKYGAEELQKFLKQISGAQLPIRSDKQPQIAKEIILGNNDHLKKLGIKIDFDALGKEGYLIRTIGDTIVIAGGQLRGNMYGVYGLLEEHLGCRWFTPKVSRIPKQSNLILDPINELYVPPLEYREPYMFECRDADWCARNRMNPNSSKLDIRHGGKPRIWSFCHTFKYLLPVEKYCDTHPEYFALVNGKRSCNTKNPQLCCTNPDVIRICIESMRRIMKASPGFMVYSVSQNDHDGHCECAKCQALAKAEESQMAPVLQLANCIADAMAKEFPDKIIQILPYQWTRKPPKTMRPRPNILVMLCSTGCCFSHPLESCEKNKDFRTDFEGWAKISKKLWIWDYATNFSHPLIPFPNIQVLSPNIRYYVAHNVTGIFEQSCGGTPGIEFAELRGYIISKFLWNPSYDPQKAIHEFLEAYYGKASKPIQAYIDLLRYKVDHDKIHLKIHAFYPYQPYLSYLSNDLLTEANLLWQKAEQFVANQPEELRRVKISRMSVDYAIIEGARALLKKKEEAASVDSNLVQLARIRMDPFLTVLESSNVKYVQGWPTSVPNLMSPQYCKNVRKDFKEKDL
ncbi:MAG: DUF4838 domain-containing protein [Lentisphaeria bacterium]